MKKLITLGLLGFLTGCSKNHSAYMPLQPNLSLGTPACNNGDVCEK